ncbi:hypothetical protein [Clostridium chrysemydis]|uniref:hypothetical protein n=1 Tax=Clostridium chrysemydis TaxID=2665504 RepID=UPI003F2BE97B
MDIKSYYKYYKMVEELKKDKGSLVFKVNGEKDTSKLYNVKIEGGKLPKGKEIFLESNSLKDILKRVYEKYNKS